MNIHSFYRCLKCGAEYRPHDAAQLGFFCCHAPLERVTPATTPDGCQQPPVLGTQLPVTTPATQPSNAPTASAIPFKVGTRRGDTEVIEVIPPREHRIDELGTELMMGSLGTDQLVSLEMGADADGVKFIFRAKELIASGVQSQIQATYDQARFRSLPPDKDPARADGTPTATAKLKLRRPCHLPLLTFRDGDFLVADPLRGLLGVFSNLREGERLLSQIILTPAPRNWADRYAAYLQPIGNGGAEPVTIESFFRQFFSIFVFMAAVALSLWAFLAFLQRHWLEFLITAPLASIAVIAVWYLFLLALERANVNRELVAKKIQSTAYDVSLRLVAFAPTPERARALLRQLAMAYRQFDCASGNALVAERAVFDPQVLQAERPSLLQELLGHVTRLNVAELAALWHLPISRDLPLIERTQAKRLIPRPVTVRHGILVGHSEHQNRNIPVHLEPESLWHHMFMVAKTQRGKSTLMAHLAAEAMRQEERTALVVIDPHGDLARSLLGRVPRHRTGDVVYLDFSDAQRVVGLNLLDMRQGRSADKIVSNIVHVGELIWRDYWGPRMADALRMALRTLLAANEKLVARGERQFSLIDIPALYELANFRHRLLKAFVADDEVLQWWGGYFERLYESLRLDVINPVLTKIHRFSTDSVVRNIVGQASSTVNFSELLNQRQILLVNTATGVIGPDAGGLLGAVIIDAINLAVREQMRIPDPKARARVVVVVDEFQSIPGVDYPALLAELQKMGASFILATQSLGQLDAIDPQLRETIIANTATLFVFQTSAEDADILRHELDESVTATDITNLADYACYIKGEAEHARLPVMHVQTLPPAPGDSAVIEQIERQMSRYTGPAAVAESERKQFKKQWYGREMDLLLDLIGRGGRPARSSRDRPAPKAASAAEPATSAIPEGDPSGPPKNAEPQLREAESPVDDETQRLEDQLRRLEAEGRDDEERYGGKLNGDPKINP